jgi:hypothetical protein
LHRPTWKLDPHIRGSDLSERGASAEKIKVKVREPFRIVFKGTAYSSGDVLEVPNDDESDLWLKAKRVELVPVSQKGKAQMPYINGLVSVGTTATLLATVGSAPENDGLLVQNNGTVAVFVGGPSVTSSGARAGVQIAANGTLTIPTTGPEPLSPVRGCCERYCQGQLSVSWLTRRHLGAGCGKGWVPHDSRPRASGPRRGSHRRGEGAGLIARQAEFVGSAGSSRPAGSGEDVDLGGPHERAQ